MLIGGSFYNRELEQKKQQQNGSVELLGNGTSFHAKRKDLRLICLFLTYVLLLPKSPHPPEEVSSDLSSIPVQKEASRPQEEAAFGFQDTKQEVRRSILLEPDPHCSQERMLRVTCGAAQLAASDSK